MDTRQIILHFILGWLITRVHAIPRVVLQNGRRRDLSASNPNGRYDLRSEDTTAISEDSYIDYDPPTAVESKDKRPNVCTNCVCGISNRKQRIVGGNLTEAHEFPWIASFTKRGVFYCAGSLITKKHILTAAHCLEGFNVKDIQIVLGDHNRAARDDSVVRRRIRRAHIHENYDPYIWNNDIAVIELDTPVHFDNIIRPACLPEDRGIDYAGAMAVAAGWGRTGERESVSDALRKVDLPILSDEECRMTAYVKKLLTPNMFCAGYLEGQRDTCQGDSGGPLHIVGTYDHLEIIGIVSWGRGCARPQYPGVFTKLTNYLGWLRDHLNGECVCPPPTSISAARH